VRIARYVIGYGLASALFLAGSLECGRGRILLGIGIAVAGWIPVFAIVPGRRAR
jgi:hypothetical protein